MTKTLRYYRRLPYTRRSQLSLEAGQRFWHAWIEELPGCEVDGETKAEACFLLEEVFEDYIRAKLEWQSPIPEPSRWPNLGKPRRRTTRQNVMARIKAPRPLPSGTTTAPPDDAPRDTETLVAV